MACTSGGRNAGRAWAHDDEAGRSGAQWGARPPQPHTMAVEARTATSSVGLWEALDGMPCSRTLEADVALSPSTMDTDHPQPATPSDGGRAKPPPGDPAAN